MLAVWGLLSLVVFAFVYGQGLANLISGEGLTRGQVYNDLLSSTSLRLFWVLVWAGGMALVFHGKIRLFSRKALFTALPAGIFSLIAASLLMWIGRVSGPEAWLRGATGVFGVLAVLAAAYLHGRVITHWFFRNTFARGIEAFVFSMALGLGSLSFLSLGLAFLGQYTPASLLMIMGATALGGLVWLLASRIRIGAHNQLDESLEISLREPTNGLWWGILFTVGMISLVGALAPESEYDALWYHLWLPAQWLQSGHPVDILEEYISLYPMNWSLLYGAAMTVGNVISAKLIHWAALLLCALSLAAFTRRFFPQAPALLAAAVFVATPTVLWESTTAYNDLGLTFYLFLAIYALERYMESDQRKWLLLTGLMVGLAMAIKHLALFGLLLLAIILFLQRLGKKEWKRGLVEAGVLGIIGLVLALPYYARSALASGNPFFPEMFGIFGATPPQRWDWVTESGLNAFKARFGFGRSLPALMGLPWLLTTRAYRFGGFLGCAYLLLLPWGVLDWRDARWWRWAGFALAYLALWASPISSFQLRFLVPLTPLLAVLAAAGYERLQATLRAAVPRLRPLTLPLLMTLLLWISLPPFTALADGPGYGGWLTHVVRQAPIAVVSGGESEQDYLSRVLSSYPAWNYINQNTPVDAYILTFSGGDHLYSQRRRLRSDSTLARPATWQAQTESQALQWLRQAGITHILADQKIIKAEDQTTIPLILQERFLQIFGRLEYQDRYYAVYRLAGDQP
ncbi:hypothetical protein ADN00_06450 [Ornatilinea apprima]|uniref:Glycosyltransferase RgtA/B/C/D-like domain-containing protein n=2 Tax=Ornatilinea apprima TaxID=1134406 RepID=A0A0P6Y0S1_9CHLR|nr:hypothetical protein ADN00_06450 [Ornatilinea apprima]